MIYMNKKLRDAALNNLRKAIDNDPKLSLAHYNLSIVLFNGCNFLLDSKDYKDSFTGMEYFV